mmetsp:Transcript_1333/g.1953  ORF Transcript_1333/g.1953 Transcript_1333/m.1953 type:complete len:223 (-) Transcript_1333:673-1341(-)
MEPMQEWTVAEMAHGTATRGSTKCAVARTTPSALFCMPTSMDTVRRSASSKPNAALAPYPSAKPAECSVATASSRLGPAAAMALLDCPMMEAQMSATVMTATRGHAGRTLATWSGQYLLSTRPPRMGNSTTCRVLTNSPPAGTGTRVPASCLVSTGVKTQARKVLTVVSTTLSATFALPRYVTRLDAVPPGQHPTRMSPTAIGCATGNTRPMANPSSGITLY